MRQDIESTLRSAVEKSVPDVLPRVMDACRQQQPEAVRVIEMPARRRRVPAARLAALCAVLALCVAASVWTLMPGRVDSIVGLDVNPSLELSVDRAEHVLSVTALNDDAQGILDGMDLKGSDLDVAVNALIGSMLKNGYISELQNSVLITVENDDPERALALQTRLSEEIGALLSASSVEPAVLGQCLAGTPDSETSRLMETYGLSQGKAALVASLLSQNPLLQEKNLVGLSVNDLNLLAASGSTQLSGVYSSGLASDKAYIGESRALELALQAAGVQSADVRRSEVELDADDGRMIYEVELHCQGVEYEVELDAGSGEVLALDRDVWEPQGQTQQNQGAQQGQGTQQNQGQTQQGQGPQGAIGTQAAMDKALAHAGVSASDVRSREAELDEDDGRWIYEIEFEAARVEYEYEIDARTGEVLSWDADYDD